MSPEASPGIDDLKSRISISCPLSRVKTLSQIDILWSQGESRRALSSSLTVTHVGFVGACLCSSDSVHGLRACVCVLACVRVSLDSLIVGGQTCQLKLTQTAQIHFIPCGPFAANVPLPNPRPTASNGCPLARPCGYPSGPRWSSAFLFLLSPRLQPQVTSRRWCRPLRASTLQRGGVGSVGATRTL
jgi:hypothetical protein